MIAIKTPEEIELMRKTCKLASSTLIFIKPYVKAGITTEELNQLCHDYIIEHEAHPSPLNYNGFPKSICTSINEVICHGIPNSKVRLNDSDIINIDITTYLNEFHGDTNMTFLIGEVRPEIKRLVDVTYKCLRAGIEIVKPGAHFGDIGATIGAIAHDNGYSVVEEYCGHGIGREFHEEPQVVHVGEFGKGAVMRPGMTFTIEPMINFGSRHCRLLKDRWTVITKDKKHSAQFEHTILVTKDGYEILTLRPEEES